MITPATAPNILPCSRAPEPANSSNERDMATVNGATKTRNLIIHCLTVGRLPRGRKVIEPAFPIICQSRACATVSSRSFTIGRITALPREFFPLPVIIRMRPKIGLFSIIKSRHFLAPAKSKSCRSNVTVPLSDLTCVDALQGLSPAHESDAA